MRLKDKVCLITGSSRGIGFSIAKSFLEEGAKVCLVGTKIESVNKARETLESEFDGSEVMGIQMDVSDTNSVMRGIEKVISRFGKIDVLVNNAGITLTKGIELINDNEYEMIMNTNMGGVFKVTREVLKYMKKDGSIINTSSMNGVYGARNQSIYSAAKAGIIGFTKALSKELGPRNIRVNAVAPGMVETDMVKEFVNDELKMQLINMTSLRRIAKPDDLTGTYKFLASDESSFITGIVISVDGGLIL